MKTQHTATPWAIDITDRDVRWMYIESLNGQRIACAIGQNKSEEKSNAEFIVRAVNSHYELVEALKELLHGMEMEASLSDSAEIRNRRRLTIAKEALAKAKGN